MDRSRRRPFEICTRRDDVEVLEHLDTGTSTLHTAHETASRDGP